MAQTFFTIDCKTNLHVGSGKTNYGVIDNLVQRDPTFQYPSIHASSLKGGIKEYCHHLGFPNMIEVFGSEKDSKGKTKHDTSQVGNYRFFDALLLTIPVRCDKRAYIHITCPGILKNLGDNLPAKHVLQTELVALSGIIIDNAEVKAYCFNESLANAVIEDFDIIATHDNTKDHLITTNLTKLFKHEIVLVQDKLFNRLTNDLHLPVIARNYLENGESKNLWYEQVVPRLSRFWSLAIHPIIKEEEIDGMKQINDILLSEEIFGDSTLVQVGANGSVGYGYCTFSKF